MNEERGLDDNNLDEEERYGSVLRSTDSNKSQTSNPPANKYVPPQKRKELATAPNTQTTTNSSKPPTSPTNQPPEEKNKNVTPVDRTGSSESIGKERWKLRASLTQEKYKNTAPVVPELPPSPKKSPLVSTLVANPRGINSLSLDPSVPKVDSETVQDFIDFTKQVKPESRRLLILNDLKNFSKQLDKKLPKEATKPTPQSQQQQSNTTATTSPQPQSNQTTQSSQPQSQSHPTQSQNSTQSTETNKNAVVAEVAKQENKAVTKKTETNTLANESNISSNTNTSNLSSPAPSTPTTTTSANTPSNSTTSSSSSASSKLNPNAKEFKPTFTPPANTNPTPAVTPVIPYAIPGAEFVPPEMWQYQEQVYYPPPFRQMYGMAPAYPPQPAYPVRPYVMYGGAPQMPPPGKKMLVFVDQIKVLALFCW